MTKTGWEEIADKIEEILLMEPSYTRPGLSEKASREIEIIHKRDELLLLFKDRFARREKELVKEIEKGIQPALDDFTAAGKVLIRSGSFEKSGNEMIENVGYIKSVFLLNKKIFDSERGKKYEI